MSGPTVEERSADDLRAEFVGEFLQVRIDYTEGIAGETLTTVGGVNNINRDGSGISQWTIVSHKGGAVRTDVTYYWSPGESAGPVAMIGKGGCSRQTGFK